MPATLQDIRQSVARSPLYHKIPIISPWLIFVQTAFFGGLIFGEAYCRIGGWEFCGSKWVGVDSKNSLKF